MGKPFNSGVCPGIYGKGLGCQRLVLAGCYPDMEYMAISQLPLLRLLATKVTVY